MSVSLAQAHWTPPFQVVCAARPTPETSSRRSFRSRSYFDDERSTAIAATGHENRIMCVIWNLTSALHEHGFPIIGQMGASWPLLLPHPQSIACICLYLGWTSGLLAQEPPLRKQPLCFRTTPDMMDDVLLAGPSSTGFPYISLETANSNSSSHPASSIEIALASGTASVPMAFDWDEARTCTPEAHQANPAANPLQGRPL